VYAPGYSAHRQDEHGGPLYLYEIVENWDSEKPEFLESPIHEVTEVTGAAQQKYLGSGRSGLPLGMILPTLGCARQIRMGKPYILSPALRVSGSMSRKLFIICKHCRVRIKPLALCLGVFQLKAPVGTWNSP
jgi:hypothetical protein